MLGGLGNVDKNHMHLSGTCSAFWFAKFGLIWLRWRILKQVNSTLASNLELTTYHYCHVFGTLWCTNGPFWFYLGPFIKLLNLIFPNFVVGDRFLIVRLDSGVCLT